MGGIEFGREAYFVHADHGENIDSDRDFSYIDRKIENFLGHYQKDFMEELSPRSLGARFGEYGSFLPVKERSPLIFSNQQTQGHVNLKSPRNLSPENPPIHHCCQNPNVAAKISLPAKDGLIPDQKERSLTDVKITSRNNQSNLQNSGKGSTHRQLSKKPMPNHSEPNLLKFRVKMTSESALSRDNSAIYTGLGLDISPFSSCEGSPSENVGASPALLEMKAESPSFILKIMTSTPLPNEALLSPLHDGLVRLMEVQNETCLAGFSQAEPLNFIHESAFVEGQKEACKESKGALNNIKAKKPKQEHTTKNWKVKQTIQMQKPVETAKENFEYIAKATDLSASRKQEAGTSVVNKTVSSSMNSLNDNSKETDKSSDLRAFALFDKKSDAVSGVEDMDIYRKQVQVARHNGKTEFGFASSDAAVVVEGNENISKRTVKGKNTTLIPKIESITDERKEPGCKDDKVSRVSKPHSLVKVKVKDEYFDTMCPKETGFCVKENGKQEKSPKEKEISLKVVEDNDKHHGIPQEVQYLDSENVESSKRSSQSKAVSHVPMGLIVKESSPLSMKKNLIDSYFNDIPKEPIRGSLGVRSYNEDNEKVFHGNNILSRSKKVEIDSHNRRELRKDSEAAIYGACKNGKEVNSRNFEVGVSEREIQPYASKGNDESSSKKSGIPNRGLKFAGGMAGGNWLVDRFSVGELPPTENAMSLEMDNWVGCEKCNKWRLLPLGVDPESLPKKWVCSMMTWLPGKNKCSVSEDETTNALRAPPYLPPASVPVLQMNNQHAHSDKSGFVNALPALQNVGLPIIATSTEALPTRGKKNTLGKSEIGAAEQSDAHIVHRPIKKEQSGSGGVRSSMNLIFSPEEPDPLKKNAAGNARPSKISKKRVADSDVSGAPKKVKKEHQQSVKDSDGVGLLLAVTKSGSRKPGDFPFSQDFVHGRSEYSHVKVKDSGRVGITNEVDEIKDVSGKKRKARDQWETAPTEEPLDRCQKPLNNLVVLKERKSSASNFEAPVEQRHRAHGSHHRHSSGHTSDGGEHKCARMSDMSLGQYHGDKPTEKTPDARKTFVKIPDLGLSDHPTTSSSSKVSGKVRLRVRQMKCSPVGSVSSSPLKISKPDSGTMTNKIAVSRREPEEMSSRKRLSSQTVGAFVPSDFGPLNEDLKEIKSTLSKTSGMISDAVDGQYFSKASSGRKPSTNRVTVQTKLVGQERSVCKLDHRYHEEKTMTLEDKPDNHLVHIDGTIPQRKKLTVPEESEKEIVPISEKGSMSRSGRAENDSRNDFRQVVDEHGNSRHPNHIGPVPNDVEASSSKRRDSLPRDAKNALREATNLKHSANRLKTSGSGQSTGIFFQAALKFLHGASLLAPDNNENGIMGETKSTEVYRSTARLCEYCAHEFEKCNDMASAALAYKCMEFAYMRVIYYNDAAASRDRVELQMAVRTAPQVDSPSSSASDIDNLNNHVAVDTARDRHSAIDHRNHVIPSGNRPNFLRLLSFMHDTNLAMEASRRSQWAFAAANPVLSQAGNEEGVSSIQRVLDFSFHDVGGLLHLVRLAMEALDN